MRVVTVWQALLCCTLAGVLPASVSVRAEGIAAGIQHSRSADVVVVSYTRIHQMIADPDPTPLLRVHGDGRVLVHFPAYMKRAGTYEYYLAEQELSALLESMSQNGAMEFEPVQAHALRAQEEHRLRDEGTQTFVSDSSYSVITLDMRTAAGASTMSGGVPVVLNKTLRWKDLQREAARYPNLPALQGLAACERDLRALLVRDGMRRLE